MAHISHESLTGWFLVGAVRSLMGCGNINLCVTYYGFLNKVSKRYLNKITFLIWFPVLNSHWLVTYFYFCFSQSLRLFAGIFHMSFKWIKELRWITCKLNKWQRFSCRTHTFSVQHIAVCVQVKETKQPNMCLFFILYQDVNRVETQDTASVCLSRFTASEATSARITAS